MPCGAGGTGWKSRVSEPPRSTHPSVWRDLDAPNPIKFMIPNLCSVLGVILFYSDVKRLDLLVTFWVKEVNWDFRLIGIHASLYPSPKRTGLYSLYRKLWKIRHILWKARVNIQVSKSDLRSNVSCFCQ